MNQFIQLKYNNQINNKICKIIIHQYLLILNVIYKCFPYGKVFTIYVFINLILQFSEMFKSKIYAVNIVIYPVSVMYPCRRIHVYEIV